MHKIPLADSAKAQQQFVDEYLNEFSKGINEAEWRNYLELRWQWLQAQIKYPPVHEAFQKIPKA